MQKRLSEKQKQQLMDHGFLTLEEIEANHYELYHFSSHSCLGECLLRESDYSLWYKPEFIS